MGFLEEAASLPALRAAVDVAVRNRGGPGPDGVTLAAFVASGERELVRLRDEVLTGAYRPRPARRIQLPKPGGGYRPIAVACVRDRVLMHALAWTLSRALDDLLHDFAYAYRRGRSAEQALARIDRALGEGRAWVLRGDIESFFDSIPAPLLLRALEEATAEPPLVALVGRLLEAGVLVGGGILDPASGTPQGSPLSPLLANLYLVPFDRSIEHLGIEMVRFGDDLCLPVPTRSEAERAREAVASSLARLRLRLNPAKVQIRHLGEASTSWLPLRARRPPAWAPRHQAAACRSRGHARGAAHLAGHERPRHGEPAGVAAPGLRLCQDEEDVLRVARVNASPEASIAGEHAGQRQLLQRHALDHGSPTCTEAAETLAVLERRACEASDVDAVRGIEGAAAAAYFGAFGEMVRVGWPFPGRQRRPPRDPINALLSYGYTLATADMARQILYAGLDGRIGLLHGLRYGRESLALDLVEELRAPLVDRFTLRLVNRRQVGLEDFEHGATRLTRDARRRYLELWEELLASRAPALRGGDDHDEDSHPEAVHRAGRSSRRRPASTEARSGHQPGPDSGRGTPPDLVTWRYRMERQVYRLRRFLLEGVPYRPLFPSRHDPARAAGASATEKEVLTATPEAPGST